MKKIYPIIMIVALIAIIGCSDHYLEEKPNAALIVPQTLSELEALLNNSELMNNAPGLGILAVDDFFMTDAGYQSFFDPIEVNSYVWDKDIYHGLKSCFDWSTPYKQIFYANTVLDGMAGIATTSANQQQYNELRGRALFHRAWAHYQIAQFFCQPYSEANLALPGIPLRLNASITSPVVRSSVKETYDQIIKDIEAAELLLPATVTIQTLPSMAAAKALHAIVSMNMDNYVDAEKFATQSLDINSTLLDYNELDATANRPIPIFNPEVSFHALSYYFSFNFSAQAYMDTVLYDSYPADDLRKEMFFRPRTTERYSFKGNYTGSVALFTGIAIDEIYLTRAESRARNGNVSGALQDLNTLLVKRWKTDTYVPYASTSKDEVLGWVMTERRKELLYRTARWSDMRRWNKDPKFQRTMARKLDGVTYTLPPNDNRYVYPIPTDEVQLSKIEQNPR